jgi:hypothetical protein
MNAVMDDLHVEESGLLAERDDLGRRVGAQDGQRPVVSRHRAPREEARENPDEPMGRATADEIVHHPAEPRGCVHLSQVQPALGPEVVERHRRMTKSTDPGRRSARAALDEVISDTHGSRGRT